MAELILAIDLGTSGCKAALIDLAGEVQAWAFRQVDTRFTDGGGAEQDPDDWWRAILEASRAAIESEGAGASVIAVCANTQGEGTIPVDRDGAALRPALLWMDTRGAPLVKERLGGLLNISGYAADKLARYIWLTGGAPSLTGKDPVGHMLYVKHHEPEIYRRTYKFLNVLDYVNLRLTGRFASTVDSIATSWVTNNRTPGAVTLDEGLCQLIGVPRDKLPEPVPCHEILGPVDDAFAQAIGVPAGTPVVAGAIDATAAAIGSGAIEDGDAHLYLGTSSWLAAHVPSKKTDLLSSIASLPCALPSKYLMIALQTAACSNLNFLLDRVIFDDDPLSPEARPSDTYGLLDELAAEAPPGARGLLYTPWIFGERAPIEDRSIRAGFHNLSLEHRRRDVARAVLEGVALNVRWILEPVERFLGQRCASIAAVGGGARSTVWCQVLADVLDRPIRQVAKPIEANVRGSAFIAAAALGRIRFEDIPGLVQMEATYTPRAMTREVYDLHFREFKNLYKANKGIHRRLNTFHQRTD
jgi:xylulokinase